MGTSTDAILFYGYELGEDPAIDSDLDKPWEDLEERVAFLLAKEERLDRFCELAKITVGKPELGWHLCSWGAEYI